MRLTSADHGNGRREILVIDDHAEARDVIALLLQRLGWSSHCAGSAEEAFALMARHHDKIGLALVDVILPDMDGMSLARELRARYSHLEIVLLSGQLNDESRWIVSDDGFRFLPKPFTLAQLRDVVAEILGEAGDNIAT